MSEINICNQCQCNFDLLQRIPLTLHCGHQVCLICFQEEYSKEGRNKCPKLECQKISLIDPQKVIEQRRQVTKDQREENKMQTEENKEEAHLQNQLTQKVEEVKVILLTKTKEQIIITAESTDTVQQLRKKIQEQEGLDPDFYGLAKGRQNLNDKQIINEIYDQKELKLRF